MGEGFQVFPARVNIRDIRTSLTLNETHCVHTAINMSKITFIFEIIKALGIHGLSLLHSYILTDVMEQIF